MCHYSKNTQQHVEGQNTIGSYYTDGNRLTVDDTEKDLGDGYHQI